MVWGFNEHFWCAFGPLSKIEALAALRLSASAWLSCGGPQGFMLGLILASLLYTSLYMCCLGPTNSIKFYADDSQVYLPYFKIYGGILFIIETWLASTVLNFNESCCTETQCCLCCFPVGPGSPSTQQSQCKPRFVSQWKVIKTNQH